MSDFSVRAATESEIEDVLSLHAANHLDALREQERANGFLTLVLTPDTLRTLIENNGLFVARGVSGELAGYVLATTWAFSVAQWPLARVPAARFPLDFEGESLDTENSFVYGPVCVAASWRGRGVLPALFEAVRRAYAPRFAHGVTYIDVRNERSLAAHTRKLGMVPLEQWQAGESQWCTLAFAT